MSFAGFVEYEKNLRTLMKSNAYKRANDSDKLELGYKLFKSKYGIGGFYGIKELKVNDKCLKNN